MTAGYVEVLERVSAIGGVQGAMLVSASDGLVVAESLMEGVDGRAVAALAAGLAGRLRRTTESAGLGTPRMVQLRAEGGTVLALPTASDLLVVVVARPDANLGLARLEMSDVARRIR